MSKVAVVGSRDFCDRDLVQRIVDNLPRNTVVVSGGARGVDSWAEDAAHLNTRLGFVEFPADWDKYGRSAGYRRNAEMVEYADRVIAFWDGESRGTKHTIDLTMDAGKPLDIYVRPEAGGEEGDDDQTRGRSDP